MERSFYDKDLDIQEPEILMNVPQTEFQFHCIVANEPFPLRIELMKLYPSRSRNENLRKDIAIFNSSEQCRKNFGLPLAS